VRASVNAGAPHPRG